jgi:hypothetical protein
MRFEGRRQGNCCCQSDRSIQRAGCEARTSGSTRLNERRARWGRRLPGLRARALPSVPHSARLPWHNTVAAAPPPVSSSCLSAKAWRLGGMSRPTNAEPVRRLFVGRAGGSGAKCCSPSCRWKKASLIRCRGRRPQPPPSPERRTSGGRRCRKCARHRHFRALGPFGARLITPNPIYASVMRGHDFS